MPIPNSLKRSLKARAQTLEPVLKLGRAGATEGFLASLARALDDHGLVKIRFTDFKDQKKPLAVEIAGRSGAELIARVGNVAVYYRDPSTESERDLSRRSEKSDKSDNSGKSDRTNP
jgi:RNA-binding protein